MQSGLHERVMPTAEVCDRFAVDVLTVIVHDSGE
jgi:hypothetical protein